LVAGLGTPDYDCAMLIERKDVPKHLFAIPGLDLSEDLCAEPLAGPWFRLGAWTFGSHRDGQGIENAVYRQSMLLSQGDFSDIFDKLESIVASIGKPGGSLKTEGDKTVYRYFPFHRFEISFTSVVAEPLVFFRDTTSSLSLLINPDLWLFFKLEEKAQAYGGTRPRESRLYGSRLLSRVRWKSLKSGLSTFPNTFRRARWRCLLNTYAVCNYTIPREI
jgi:hypothetical protein